MTFRELASLIINKLEKIYGYREARAIQRYIFTALHNNSTLEWLKDFDLEVDKKTEAEIFNILNLLINQMPVQYAVGKAWFCNLELKINPEVLIPRPETEELVNFIIHDAELFNPQTAIDIGTGSGAIAVTLGKLIPDMSISAIDISESAIGIARQNAEKHGVNIEFFHFDILKYLNEKTSFFDYFSNKQFDIIVSNPPYVKESEKIYMSRNVLEYEPHTALFVTDDDPLIFYRAILNFSVLHLSPKGNIYMEINENESENLTELLKRYGYTNIMVIKDINGKERFIKACS